ncbi:hypothetical protein AAMO2058_001584000, partial [Amorphochlora amoebiformis]
MILIITRFATKAGSAHGQSGGHKHKRNQTRSQSLSVQLNPPNPSHDELSGSYHLLAHTTYPRKPYFLHHIQAGFKATKITCLVCHHRFLKKDLQEVMLTLPTSLKGIKPQPWVSTCRLEEIRVRWITRVNTSLLLCTCKLEAPSVFHVQLPIVHERREIPGINLNHNNVLHHANSHASNATNSRYEQQASTFQEASSTYTQTGCIYRPDVDGKSRVPIGGTHVPNTAQRVNGAPQGAAAHHSGVKRVTSSRGKKERNPPKRRRFAK